MCSSDLRLVASASPEFREVVTAWLAHTASPEPLDVAAVNALIAKVAADACASSLAHLLAADSRQSGGERRTHLDEAQQDAERCGDDRLRAETALATAQHMIGNEWLSEGVTAKLRLADAAVNRIAQRDLTAQVDLIRTATARRAWRAATVCWRGSMRWRAGCGRCKATTTSMPARC